MDSYTVKIDSIIKFLDTIVQIYFLDMTIIEIERYLPLFWLDSSANAIYSMSFHLNLKIIGIFIIFNIFRVMVISFSHFLFYY